MKEDYQERRNKFIAETNAGWEDSIRAIFPMGTPDRASWTNLESIINVLNGIAKPNLNHWFFPDGGGNDLEGVSISNEAGCIELNFGTPYILKPKRLIFEFPNQNYVWAYFRVESVELTAVNTNMSFGFSSEAVDELYPGFYKPESTIDNMRYQEEEVPAEARSVIRMIKGDHVLFSKTSNYNLNSGTYDGRHNNMATDEFRNYIERVITELN